MAEQELAKYRIDCALRLCDFDWKLKVCVLCLISLLDLKFFFHGVCMCVCEVEWRVGETNVLG